MSFFASLWADIKQGFDFAFSGNHAAAREQIVVKLQAAVSALKAQIAVAETEGLFGTAERDAIAKAETDVDAALAALAADNNVSAIQNVMALITAAIALLPTQFRMPAQMALSAAAVLIPTILAQAPAAQ